MEFAEWAAYYEVEPWGEDRADVRTAILAMLVANALKPADAEPRQLVDFLARDFVGLVPPPGTPHRLARPKRQTNADRKSVFDRIRAQAPPKRRGKA